MVDSMSDLNSEQRKIVRLLLKEKMVVAVDQYLNSIHQAGGIASSTQQVPAIIDALLTKGAEMSSSTIKDLRSNPAKNAEYVRRNKPIPFSSEMYNKDMNNLIIIYRSSQKQFNVSSQNKKVTYVPIPKESTTRLPAMYVSPQPVGVKNQL